MANINTKEHVFVMVQGKNGPERREVKARQEDYKLRERMKLSYELALRRKKRTETT